MFNDSQKTQARQGIFLILFLGMTAFNFSAAEAASPGKDVKEGNRLYEQGDYAGSKEKYTEALKKAPESDIINFNMGTALYKNKKYQDAVDHFQKVFLSEDDALKAKAYYNAGNALYRSGIVHEQDNALAHAVNTLEQSLKQYERALAIDTEDDDTKHNITFVTKELQRLREKRQQEQQQQSQQQKHDQSQEQQSGRSQQQDQNQTSQGQQGQESQEQQQAQEDQSQHSSGQEGVEESEQRQASGAQQKSASQLTKEEARMLLESYQQGEEPQGQLNVHQQKKDARPVAKDW